MIEAIMAVGGLVLPPVVDFFRKKFLKPNQDTPEATMATLATTNPEKLADYVKHFAELLKAKKEYYNRDVIGIPGRYIINLRAGIRPHFVILACVIRVFGWYFNWPIDEGFKGTCDMCISNWFGCKIIR